MWLTAAVLQKAISASTIIANEPGSGVVVTL
jgi:hypothetical protein